MEAYHSPSAIPTGTKDPALPVENFSARYPIRPHSSLYEVEAEHFLSAVKSDETNEASSKPGELRRHFNNDMNHEITS